MITGFFALGGIVLGWLLKRWDDQRAMNAREAERANEIAAEHRRWARDQRVTAYSAVLAAERSCADAFALYTAHSNAKSPETIPRLEQWMAEKGRLETAYAQAVLLGDSTVHEALNILRATLFRSFGVTIPTTPELPDVSIEIARVGFIAVAQLDLKGEWPNPTPTPQEGEKR